MRTCRALLTGGLASLLCLACSEPPVPNTLPVVEQTDAEAPQVQEPPSVDPLVERIDVLEARVALLEEGKSLAQAQEEEARKLYETMKKAYVKGDYETARTQVAQLLKDYPKTDSYKRSKRIESELSLFDQPSPVDAQTHIQEWFTENTAMSLDGNLGWSKGTSLVVFWERWCPGCRTHMPDLQKTYERWDARGLSVMALTRVTRTDTREEVAAFISEEGLTLPIAKEDGQLASFFKVQALPAAAVIRDGVVIWRGDPKRITDTDLKSWTQD